MQIRSNKVSPYVFAGLTLERRREIATEKRGRIGTADIINAVQKVHGVGYPAMRSKTRQREIARARQHAMFLMTKYTQHTLSKIGRTFNRTHATVLHAEKAWTNELLYPEVKAQHEKVLTLLS